MRPAAVPKYKRILLKLSGEALMGEDAFGINRQTINNIVSEIATVVRMGVEIGAVIGGGNIFRGVAPGAAGMDRATADYMGMLATVMNALALQDAMRHAGAIKAGAYCNLEPGKVARLMLHAHTHHGKHAPEMARRRSIIEELKATPRRPFGKAQVDNVFNRDKSGQTDPAIIQWLEKFEMKFGDSIPAGTYIDMAINLPLVDPAKITCPVLVSRPDHDGNSTEAELYEFYAGLASREKQFHLMRGLPHGGAMVGHQRKRMWYVMHAFFGAPEAPPAEAH